MIFFIYQRKAALTEARLASFLVDESSYLPADKTKIVVYFIDKFLNISITGMFSKLYDMISLSRVSIWWAWHEHQDINKLHVKSTKYPKLQVCLGMLKFLIKVLLYAYNFNYKSPISVIMEIKLLWRIQSGPQRDLWTYSMGATFDRHSIDLQ